jgi:hypothetical protein
MTFYSGLLKFVIVGFEDVHVSLKSLNIMLFNTQKSSILIDLTYHPSITMLTILSYERGCILLGLARWWGEYSAGKSGRSSAV